MFKSLLLVTLALLSPELTEAAVTTVQVAQNSATSPAVTTFAKAFTSNITAGNFIWAVCEHAGLGGINAPTDTLGNTYTQLGTTQNNGSLGQIAQFSTHSTTGGADTVTCNYGASATVPAIAIFEIAGSSGPDASGTPGFISNFQASVGSGVGAVTSGNLTPSVANGMLIGVTFDSGLNDTMTVDTGTDLFAGVAFWRFTDTVNHGAASSQTYTSTTPLPALFTASSTNSAPGTVAALFAASGVPVTNGVVLSNGHPIKSGSSVLFQ